jgi:hypothetical protein
MKSIEEQLQKAVTDLVPKSIDDVIRKRRDECQVRMANLSELISLPAMESLLNHPKPVRAIIDGWHVVCITLLFKRMYILVGINRSRRIAWSTSDIVSFDLANNLVLTRNSLYELGIKSEEEQMHPSLLLHLCATMLQWGFRDFGIPEVFY